MTGHTDRNVSTVPITARLRETAAHMIDRAALRHLHKIRKDFGGVSRCLTPSRKTVVCSVDISRAFFSIIQQIIHKSY